MENKELSKQLCAVFNLKGITSKEIEKHPLEDLKNDEITKKREK